MLGSQLYYLFVRPYIYEYAIVCGTSLLMLALWFWLSAANTAVEHRGALLAKLALGSLCMALVAGCRPQMELFAVLALQLADERLLALDESVPARLGGEPWSQDPDFAKITPPARSSATAPACRIGTAALCPCSLPRVRLIAIPARAIICCSTWRKNYGTISPGAVCGPCFHALSNAPLRRALDAGGGQRHFSGL